MCIKAKFLFPKFRSLKPNTPDVHHHTHSTDVQQSSRKDHVLFLLLPLHKFSQAH
jgi:hypothetical protein